mgnify:FL=1
MWDSIWKSIAGLFSGGGGMGATAAGDAFGETAQAAGGGSGFGGFGGLLGSAAKAVAPAVIPAAIGGFAQLVAPDQPGSAQALDPRTAEGRAAEGHRLSGASAMASSLRDPNAGMTPEELQDVRRTSRAADAARGAFDTGRSAQRENLAIQSALSNRRQQNIGNLGSLTTGYTPRNVTKFEGQENPWAKILTGMGSGFGRMLERKWWA